MTLKKLPTISLKFLLTFTFLSSSLLLTAQAPTHRGKFDFIDNNINGFWEYLPRDFQTDVGKRYPLLIFIHGAGEGGNQPNMETLNWVKVAGVPYLIDQGNFPESFEVNGEQFRFIVISPQIKNGIEIVNNVGTSIIQPSTIDAIINYAKTTYPNRIDESRIYLSGLSMGGGAVWDYAGSSVDAARKIAAIVVAAGAGDVSQQEANNIAEADLPVLATHNNEDAIVPVTRTQANIARIVNQLPQIEPEPQPYYFNTGVAGNHNVWTATFEELQPRTTNGGNLPQVLGTNVYQWMLQQQRTLAALPVTWERFIVTTAGQQIRLEWTVSNEKKLKSYEVQRSADGNGWTTLSTITPQEGNAMVRKYIYSDARPLSPVNYYRVKQTDLDGRFTYSPLRTISFSAQGNGIVFPNPVGNKLFIGFSDNQHKEVTVEIFSSTGGLLRREKKQITGNQVEVEVSGRLALASGLLLLRVTDIQGQMLFQQKILKN